MLAEARRLRVLGKVMQAVYGAFLNGQAGDDWLTEEFGSSLME